jgi:ribosomal protein S19
MPLHCSRRQVVTIGPNIQHIHWLVHNGNSWIFVVVIEAHVEGSVFDDATATKRRQTTTVVDDVLP